MWLNSTKRKAPENDRGNSYSSGAGLRRGEATALTWADVDLDARTISVTKSWDFAAGRVKGPKTAAGERVVHIPRLLVDYLRAEREADPDTLYVVHTARDQMGHSSVQVTQEIYTHLDARYKEKKMEALDEYLKINAENF